MSQRQIPENQQHLAREARSARPLESRYKLYRSPFSVCSACPFRDKCLSESNVRQRHGRTLGRSEYEEAVIENRRRILRHRDKYKRRQVPTSVGIEHPFGTIKRGWGSYYTLLKGKEKVSGEMGASSRYTPAPGCVHTGRKRGHRSPERLRMRRFGPVACCGASRAGETAGRAAAREGECGRGLAQVGCRV